MNVFNIVFFITAFYKGWKVEISKAKKCKEAFTPYQVNNLPT